MPAAQEVKAKPPVHSDHSMTIKEILDFDKDEIYLFEGTSKEYAENYLEETGTNDTSVVLLDLNMPLMGGIEALTVIREKNYYYFPIVVLSSSKEHPDVEKCYELGVNSFVSKPVKTAELQEAVRTLGLYWALMNILPK